MEREYKMSAARAQELQEELNYLKTTRSDEVAEQIKVARGFGDLSENSEYDEAKNEQGKLYSRIAELEEILQHVVIVDESNAPTNVVTIGCKGTVGGKKGNASPDLDGGGQERQHHARLPHRGLSGVRPHERHHFRGVSLRQGPGRSQGGGHRYGGGPQRRHRLHGAEDRAVKESGHV